MHMLPLPVHTSQLLPALVTSVLPVPLPQSLPEWQCYPETRGLEPGGSNRNTDEGRVSKKGGTTYSMYAKIERLCHALVETEINITPTLDQKPTHT